MYVVLSIVKRSRKMLEICGLPPKFLVKGKQQQDFI
jgi:hypothetical protein